MTFYSWLLLQNTRDDTIGDIARDAESDKCFPVGSICYEQIFTHLCISHHASNVALHAFRVAFLEYSTEFLRFCPLLRHERNRSYLDQVMSVTL